ncbi:MAG: polysaccharide biosynthesis tyrosine autokinase [Clostridiales bacterium]|nr:polysaccharide biosynthesis tyrosine autokinase [Clostridiales bacterium]MBE5810071.1 polysaccharide biosynthesis tyrosine autokinase [Clostridiales bacterium]
MDELQKQPEGMQTDPQMVATVTAAVLQTLQATGTIPPGEQKSHPQPEVKTIDLIGLFFAILEKFWLVVICAIMGALIMGWLAGRGTTTYTATSKLYIVDTSSGSINIANLQLGTVLTLDYQEVFKTWEVHEMVIEDLGLPYSYEQMQSLISISNPQDTRILYITVRYPDAKMAADIANAYAKAAKTFIINTMRGEEPSDFSIALEPSVGYRVSKSSRMVMGFMLGSVMAVGLITLLFVLDNRPRSPEQIQQYGGIPTLAVFPDRPKGKAAPRRESGVAAEPTAGMPLLEVTQFPESDFVSHEAMNTLCTNLSYCGPDVRKVMITSRYAGEGKSYVSMNLMRTMAKLGRRVVLVDTDLRASGIQADYQLRYSTEKHYGLSDYLSAHCSVAEVLYQTNIPGAFMIPAGHEAPNPLQLLDTPTMKRLVEWLSTQFDVVLIDTPPVGVLVDAVAMAKFCDGALLVVGYRKGNQSEIGEAVKNIKQTGCKMLGGVLNGVKFRSLSNKHYYYSSERYSGHYSKRYKYGQKAK